MKPKYFLYDKAFERILGKYKNSLNETDLRTLKKQFEIFRKIFLIEGCGRIN
jgi:hypothetical protein